MVQCISLRSRPLPRLFFQSRHLWLKCAKIASSISTILSVLRILHYVASSYHLSIKKTLWYLVVVIRLLRSNWRYCKLIKDIYANIKITSGAITCATGFCVMSISSKIHILLLIKRIRSYSLHTL